uniref:CHY zinc finger domain containing protein n=2 Tax=Babesia bovis TaxID=5865 RepID=S6BH31_BABBO|nr:CHY zinc finger domain containing protein [Babesia bovis]BAN65499.1 CHY zinc finger domain containing protein [Babesia bovis]
MSQQLVTSDRGYIELYKLEKLFGARFALSSAVDQLDTVSIDDVYRNDSIIAHVVLRPTDPEFNISLLKGESCINLSLCLHRVPGVSLESSHGYYTISQASDIDVKGDHLGRDVKLVLKKVILTFLGKYLTTTPYAIYECLKLVDRELCHIFEICGHSSKNTTDTSNSKVRESNGDTWSLEEQKSLEFALGKTKGIPNATERWSAVAAIVKTKSADECRLRFQRCREQLLNKANEHKKTLAGMPAEYETVLARSDPLRLLSLELEAISVFNVVNIVVQLGCTRCSTAFDVILAHGDRKTAVMSRHCDKCNMAQLVEFQPEIAFASQPALGNLKLENCIFLDYITGEFFVTCQSCDTQCKVRDVQNGTCKRSVCRGCFAKLALSFTGVEFGQDNSVSRYVCNMC